MEANGNLSLDSESPTEAGEKRRAEQVTSDLKLKTESSSAKDLDTNGLPEDPSQTKKLPPPDKSDKSDTNPADDKKLEGGQSEGAEAEADPGNTLKEESTDTKDEVDEPSEESNKTVKEIEAVGKEEKAEVLGEEAKPENSMDETSQTNNMDSSGAILAEESSSAADTSAARKERKKKKTRSELDRLLMDEGTVRILMGSPRGTAQTAASKEEKLKALNKHREEAINQVRDSSKTKIFNKVSLRLKSKSRRQQQQEQRNAKKAKLSEPASKIIRRRSSSSNFNFSSRSPSPAHMGGASIQSSAEDTVQVRIHDSVGYITIDAEAITFNTQIASRLTAILNSLKINETVTVVQLTTTSDFIQGLDIQGIRSETDDSLRESMADSMIACLDSLLKTLINYPKLLVAGVSGDAVDFGVLILSYFDMVYASDKATFQTNYGKNGYLPECLQFFPKNRLTYAMLYTGKKLTATEGVTSGLVTEVLWPAKFQEELASRIRTITSASQEVLLRTKGEVNTKNSSKLELARDLRSSWLRF